MTRNPEASEGTPVELTGTLERFTFRSPDSGFAVVRFRPNDGSPAVTAVGELAQLAEGQTLRIAGTLRNHPRYGAQIEVRSCEADLPHNAAGIRAYLGSGLVRGIGPALAERLVERFGTDTLRVIAEAPERLAEVRGLGKKRATELVAAVRAQRDVQELLVFLRAHGLGQALAGRIVQRFGPGASALIHANPYRLADEVLGIGFRTADRLARTLGLAADAPERLEAGIVHVLGEAAREGHSFLPIDDVTTATARLLGCETDAVRALVPELAARNRVVREPIGAVEEAVYPRLLHAAESGLATALERLIAAPPQPLPFDPGATVRVFEETTGRLLAERQRAAVVAALTSGVSVITGGPGVGKTTIVQALAHALESNRLPILLAAPTGRAAKRLEESTGRPAQTIHRLLEFQPGVWRFQRDARRPLEGAMLVVDEASMLDVVLARQLLEAVPAQMRVVLVGDVDQLPAVGPGNVLGDLIASGRVPVTRLTEVFRQASRSHIVRAAHAILAGDVPQGSARDGDFFVVEARDPAHARTLVLELVTRRIPSAFGMSALHDVQVLCPMYRGVAGADALNADLQAALNPDGEVFARGTRTMCVGDKVMQVKNDYDLDVYNGDVGLIRAFDRTNGTVAVDFGGRRVAYPVADLDRLVPAHAITVHRAQGSEYPCVVVPVLTEHYLMLRRNLLYTAITRGKRLVVVVAMPRALALAIRNDEQARRWSGLAHRLAQPNGTDTNA